MENDNNAVEEFLNGLKPKENPFESKDLEPEKAEGEEGKEEDVVDVKPVPFNKDPKVQRYIDKQVAQALESHKPTEVEKFQKEANVEIPDVLVKIIGNDTPEKQQALKEFAQYLGGLEEKGAQRAIKELENQANAQAQEDVRAQEELDESFGDIEEEYGVDLSSNTAKARQLRTQFVDYVRKIAPKNEDGEVVAFPDMQSAFETFQERQQKAPATSTRAKEIASRGVSRSSDATLAPKTTGKSWKDIEKLFNSLSN